MKKVDYEFKKRQDASQKRESEKTSRGKRTRSTDYNAALARLFQDRSRPRKPLKTIKVPTSLNLDTEFESTLSLLSQIRGALLYGDNGGINLDLSGLCDISTEVALLLVAEIDRCIKFRGPKVTKGNYPGDIRASAILSEIGYFSFFKIPEPHVPKSDRVLLKSTYGDETIGEVADQLLSVFEKLLNFQGFTRQRMYGGLIECMQNVKHHAYRHKRLSGRVLGRWWMNGFSDPITGEVTFSFVDQGIGIPTTLRETWRDWLKGLVLSDSDLVFEAVKNRHSSLHNARRGNGLPFFYEVLMAAPEGQFRIMSNNAIVTFQRNGVEQIVTPKTTFQGTMISWSLFPRPRNQQVADKI